MNIEIQRKYVKANYTIGSLSLPLGGDGEGPSFFCNTLEPPIGTETESRTAGSKKAIPAGTYNIRMAWSVKFHQHLPLIENIPTPLRRAEEGKSSESSGVEAAGDLGGRSSILIHAGNTVQDTAGCILVGKNTKVGKVLESRKTLSQLVDKIRAAISQGEEVKIIIKAPL